MRFKPEETSVNTTKRVYTHTQSIPSKEWNVPHMLGGTVGTVVMSDNNELTLDVDYQVFVTSNNNLIIKFTDQLNHIGITQCILQNSTESVSNTSINLTAVTTSQVSLLSKHSTNECLVKVAKTVNGVESIEYVKAVKSGKITFNTTFWNVFSFDITDIQTNTNTFTFSILGLYFSNDVLIEDVNNITFSIFPQFFLCYDGVTLRANQIALNGLFSVNSLTVFAYSENIKNLQLPIRKN